ERVSEYEKLFIEAEYYTTSTGDLEKARQAYELLAQTYPRDATARNSLSFIHSQLGQYGEALVEIREALRLDPEIAQIYGNVVYAYLSLNRFEEALATAEEAKVKKLDLSDVHGGLYLLAFLRSDAGGMKEQVAWGADRPGEEDWFLGYEGDTAAYAGRLQKA